MIEDITLPAQQTAEHSPCLPHAVIAQYDCCRQNLELLLAIAFLHQPDTNQEPGVPETPKQGWTATAE